MKWLFAFGAFLFALTASLADAEACSLAAMPRLFSQDESVIALPSNGAIFDASCFSSGIAATRDDALSTLFGIDVRRLSPEPAVGTTFASSTCPSRSIRVASAVDMAAPSQVVIDRVRTIRVRNPSSGSGFGCPEPDVLEITMAARDDVATDAQLGLLAFVGATAAEVDNATTARSVLSPEIVDGKLVVRAWLGVRDQRSGGNGFDRSGPMCFSFAAFDRSANVGMRSVARCLDTTSASEPTVEFVQGHGGCSVRAGAARGDRGAALWLTAIALAATWGARRRAKRQ